jgi:hypothetical protein
MPMRAAALAKVATLATRPSLYRGPKNARKPKRTMGSTKEGVIP